MVVLCRTEGDHKETASQRTLTQVKLNITERKLITALRYRSPTGNIQTRHVLCIVLRASV